MVRHICDSVGHTLYSTAFQYRNKMDVVWDDNGDLIDLVMMLFFTPGGEFTLENEVLHQHVEDEEQPAVWGGSRPGKAPNLEQHRVMYSHLLYNDFWGPSPVYNAMYFKKLFKLPIGLVDEIVERIVLQDTYFIQETDAAGKLGFLYTAEGVFFCSSPDIGCLLHGTR